MYKPLTLRCSVAQALQNSITPLEKNIFHAAKFLLKLRCWSGQWQTNPPKCSKMIKYHNELPPLPYYRGHICLDSQASNMPCRIPGNRCA